MPEKVEEKTPYKSILNKGEISVESLKRKGSGLALYSSQSGVIRVS